MGYCFGARNGVVWQRRPWQGAVFRGEGLLICQAAPFFFFAGPSRVGKAALYRRVVYVVNHIWIFFSGHLWLEGGPMVQPRGSTCTPGGARFLCWCDAAGEAPGKARWAVSLTYWACACPVHSTSLQLIYGSRVGAVSMCNAITVKSKRRGMGREAANQPRVCMVRPRQSGNVLRSAFCILLTRTGLMTSADTIEGLCAALYYIRWLELPKAVVSGQVAGVTAVSPP